MWKHNKKYKSRKYKGGYSRLNNGDRVFFLMCLEPKHIVSFESHEQAKKQGWVKG